MPDMKIKRKQKKKKKKKKKTTTKQQQQKTKQQTKKKKKIHMFLFKRLSDKRSYYNMSLGVHPFVRQ